jgi:hypothetical protein
LVEAHPLRISSTNVAAIIETNFCIGSTFLDWELLVGTGTPDSDKIRNIRRHAGRQVGICEERNCRTGF